MAHADPIDLSSWTSLLWGLGSKPETHPAFDLKSGLSLISDRHLRPLLRHDRWARLICTMTDAEAFGAGRTW